MLPSPTDFNLRNVLFSRESQINLIHLWIAATKLIHRPDKPWVSSVVYQQGLSGTRPEYTCHPKSVYEQLLHAEAGLPYDNLANIHNRTVKTLEDLIETGSANQLTYAILLIMTTSKYIKELIIKNTEPELGAAFIYMFDMSIAEAICGSTTDSGVVSAMTPIGLVAHAVCLLPNVWADRLCLTLVFPPSVCILPSL
jgi:hypothetical protein